MDDKAIHRRRELKNRRSDGPVVAFDFERASDETYRDEDKAARDAHKSHIADISFHSDPQ